MRTDKNTIDALAVNYARRYTDKAQRAAAYSGYMRGYEFAEKQEQTARIEGGRICLKFEPPEGQPVTFHDLYMHEIEVMGYVAGYQQRKMW